MDASDSKNISPVYTSLKLIGGNPKDLEIKGGASMSSIICNTGYISEIKSDNVIINDLDVKKYLEEISNYTKKVEKLCKKIDNTFNIHKRDQNLINNKFKNIRLDEIKELKSEVKQCMNITQECQEIITNYKNDVEQFKEDNCCDKFNNLFNKSNEIMEEYNNKIDSFLTNYYIINPNENLELITNDMIKYECLLENNFCINLCLKIKNLEKNKIILLEDSEHNINLHCYNNKIGIELKTDKTNCVLYDCIYTIEQDIPLYIEIKLRLNRLSLKVNDELNCVSKYCPGKITISDLFIKNINLYKFDLKGNKLTT